MKIIPWLLVVFLGATTAMLFSNAQKRDLDIATLRAQVEQFDALRAELDDARKTQVNQNELERLRKESDEVYKLRNQVAQLQKKLKEIPPPPAPEIVYQQFQEPPPPPPPTEPVPETPTEDPVTRQQREQCLHNMNVIEEAKTMWAVANNKQAGERMTVIDITTALPNSSMPLCPSGGVYNLNEVGIPVSCSISSHSLVP